MTDDERDQLAAELRDTRELSEAYHEELLELYAERDRLQKVVNTLNQNTDASFARAIDVQVENKRLAARVTALEGVVRLAAIFARDVEHGPCAGADNVLAWSVMMKQAGKLREVLDAVLGGQEAGSEEE